MSPVSSNNRRVPAALERWRWFAPTLLIGLAGAAFFVWAQWPLPWLLGPLLSVAAVRICGVPLVTPPPVRRGGQWVIGVALGLYFTPAVIGQMMALWWPILLGLVFALVLSLSVALLYRRAGLDPPTAFFSATLGGASEMAIIGQSRGADIGVLAAIHSVRVLIVVVAIPFAYKVLELSGSDVYAPAVQAVSVQGLLVMLVLTGAGASLLRWLRWPNQWMLGPLLVTVILTATGFSFTALPTWLINAAQVAIGVALGARFSPESMRTVRDIAGLVLLVTAGSLLAAGLFGTLLATITGLPIATMVLATSPGGIAEMSVTAKALALGVPVVTVFHVTRLVFVLLTCLPVYRWLALRRGWDTAVVSNKEVF